MIPLHSATVLHPQYVGDTVIQAPVEQQEIVKNEPPVPVVMTFEVTAYTDSPEENGNSAGLTAMGTRLRPGVVACNDLKLGTVIRIDGNEYIVEDRMAHSGVIDIYMDSYDDAIAWGRRVKEVEIVE